MTAEERIAFLAEKLNQALEQLSQTQEQLRLTQEQLGETQKQLGVAQARIEELEKQKTPPPAFVKATKGLLKNNFRLPILLKNWDTRSKGIVPLGTNLGIFNVELLHLLIGNLLTFGILSFQQSCSHGQSRLSRGSTNGVEQRLKAA